jgi:anti-sigma B factor antagonist
MCLIDGANRATGSESSTSQTPSRLSLREHALGGEHTLVLSGELDLASRPLFDKALRCVQQRRISALVLDLGEVTFMDSTGLHGVLTAKSLCARYGCEFVVTRGSSQVQRLFELSGFIDELPFRAARAA